MGAVTTGLAFLADSGEEKKAGPLALAIILVLFIACYFLFRSMSRHLKKVRTDFPVGSRRAEPPADTTSGGPGGSDGDAPEQAGSRDPADSRPPGSAEAGPPAS